MPSSTLEADVRARLERYLALTARALERVRASPPHRSFLHGASTDLIGMAKAYLEDARHFQQEGDLPRALAAVSYAHAWLDVGVRLGLLDGGDDDQTFTQFR